MLALWLGLLVAAAPADALERRVGDYTVRVERSLATWRRTLVVYRGQERLYERRGEGGGFFMENERDVRERLARAREDDAHVGKAQDRVPVVVGEWTGGITGSLRFHAFSLGKRFRYLGSTDDLFAVLSLVTYGRGQEVSDVPPDDRPLEDLDGDGQARELRERDLSFAFGIPPFWPRDEFESPAPRIVLRQEGDGFVLAPELMRKPPPTDAELVALAARLRGGELADIADAYLALAYSGHLDDAERLVGLAWNDGHKPVQVIQAEFRAKLAESPFCRRLFPEPICARGGPAPARVPRRGEPSRVLVDRSER